MEPDGTIKRPKIRTLKAIARKKTPVRLSGYMRTALCRKATISLFFVIAR
jgi:hypothetical protein